MTGTWKRKRHLERSLWEIELRSTTAVVKKRIKPEYPTGADYGPATKYPKEAKVVVDNLGLIFPGIQTLAYNGSQPSETVRGYLGRKCFHWKSFNSKESLTRNHIDIGFLLDLRSPLCLCNPIFRHTYSIRAVPMLGDRPVSTRKRKKPKEFYCQTQKDRLVLNSRPNNGQVLYHPKNFSASWFSKKGERIKNALFRWLTKRRLVRRWPYAHRFLLQLANCNSIHIGF